jgi:UPF0755 protein
MKRRKVLILLSLAFPLLIIAALLSKRSGYAANVLVERGQYSVRSIVESIWYDFVVSDPMFVEYAIKIGLRLTGRSITPGVYRIQENATQYDIITMFVFGKREPLVKITIPEGFTIFQIASRLKHRAQIDSAKFIDWCRHAKVLESYKVSSPSMEGFLMPATYHVIRTEPWHDVGRIMADESLRLWTSIAGSTNISRDSITTLASIVQRESGDATEMPRIAGVYINRLRIGMRLQADPTVQYLTGTDRITGSELRDASNSYNTYVHSGLPPGPICNPGKDALKAAMKPETHSWIFFVAREDGSMRHRFAVTLAEHNQNVRLYREAIRRAPSN